MEVRIGIIQSPRELTFETNVPAEELKKTLAAALTGGEPLVTFSDTKGKEYFVSAASIAYIEVGGDTGRKVGFVS